MDTLHDRKFNIRLVKVIQKYPCLYNSDLPGYSCRENRERAWIEVGEEMNCDPKSLLRKWQNFRTILVRKLKQKQLEETTSQYYLFPYLKFLIPYLKKSYEPGSIKRTKILPNHTSTKDNEEANVTYQYDDVSNQSLEESNINPDADDNQDPIYFADDLEEVNSANKVKRSVSSEYEDIIEEEKSPKHDQQNEISLNNSISTCNKHVEPTSSHILTSSVGHSNHHHLDANGDPRQQFLSSLLPDLYEMTNSQMREFKSKTLLLVQNILQDNAM